ncbi:hypothetical protein GGR56DRAFT_628017 [Xylariaceae sp. FL0804]|nr:hypothetical protein GGR56DRAFT_628017 [Xylariaceae sp. FL0804]
MVRTRRERKRADDGIGNIKLAQPDRSGPSDATLLELAQERNLFAQADQHPFSQNQRQKRPPRRKKKEDGDGEEVEEEEENELELEQTATPADRVLEAVLWSVSLAMLHFTLDVLVQHQYAMDVVWADIASRALAALVVFLFLMYVLHPHASAPALLPGLLPAHLGHALRQGVFLAASLAAGCYLIHISTAFGYVAVMKQSPPLGCLWIWSVVELDLPLALLSVAGAAGFYYQGGYSIRQ